MCHTATYSSGAYVHAHAAKTGRVKRITELEESRVRVVIGKRERNEERKEDYAITLKVLCTLKKNTGCEVWKLIMKWSVAVLMSVCACVCVYVCIQSICVIFSLYKLYF